MYNLCFNITVYLILNGFWRKKDSEKECSRIQHFSCIKHFVQSCVCVYIHICAYTFLRTCLFIVSDHRNGKYHGLSVFWQKDIFTGICNKCHIFCGPQSWKEACLICISAIWRPRNVIYIKEKSCSNEAVFLHWKSISL